MTGDDPARTRRRTRSSNCARRIISSHSRESGNPALTNKCQRSLGPRLRGDERLGAELLGPNVSASLFQPLDHVIELIEITVADAERAATAAALIDTDGQTERIC